MSFTINLTASLALPNAQRIMSTPPIFNDDLAECRFSMTLITSAAVGAKICSWNMVIRNGLSSQIVRQGTPPVGLNIEDINRYIVMTAANEIPERNTPTGYTDLFNAWKAGVDGPARQAAFKTALMTAGHVDSTLAGT